MDDYDYLFKILLVGDSCVGKSSLLLKFTENCFCDQHISTIGVDFKIHTININGKIIKLQIWDTAGQERFRTITTSYYRGAHGIIMVYDITNKESFTKLRTWCDEITQFNDNNAVVIMVGNKSDLTSDRNIEYKTGKCFADNLNIDFLETSAKDSSNVEDAFVSLAEKIKNRMLLFPDEMMTKKDKQVSLTTCVRKIKIENRCCP